MTGQRSHNQTNLRHASYSSLGPSIKNKYKGRDKTRYLELEKSTQDIGRVKIASAFVPEEMGFHAFCR